MQILINPNLISVYDSEYLLFALRKPSVPGWLKKKIEIELTRRGVLQPQYNYNNNSNTVVDIEVRYYIEKVSDSLYLCYNEFDHYFSFTPSCESNQ